MPIDDTLLEKMIETLNKKLTISNVEIAKMSSLHTSLSSIRLIPKRIKLEGNKEGFEIVKSRPNHNNLNKSDLEKTAEIIYNATKKTYDDLMNIKE